MTTPEQPTQPTPEQRPTWPGWWVILGAVIVLVAILAVVYLGDGETDDTTVTTDTTEESGTTSPDVRDHRGCGDRGSDGDNGGLLEVWRGPFPGDGAGHPLAIRLQ